MAGADNRIVTMQFNNREFESNARTSLSTLQKLKEQMNFGSVVGGTIKGLGSITGALGKIGLSTPFAPMIKAANTGLSMVGGVLDKLGLKNPFSGGVQSASDLQRAAAQAGGPAGMGALEGGVTAVSGKFIAMTTIAITALSNITSKAISSTTAWLKSFTLQPIMDGLNEYQTNLQAIQTVQANTDRPLPEINSALQQLNTYSDQTIYNFSEMAKNVGTFTAAGVDLQTSVSAIKGIANMAALSGSNSQQAATAMYQLSQALASGKVGLMDWNSVVNAGMGGKKLQGALAQTAIAMGKIDAAQVKGTASGKQLTIMGKSFRESIMAQPGQQSWLTSDILKNSLAALDGRYSAAAVSQEKLKNGTLRYKNAAQVTAAIEKARNDAAKNGVKYTDAQFAALQKLSTSAFKAATKVKTLGQVFDVAKETIGSGWSSSFQNIFGNLSQAKKLFTGMSNSLNGMINKNALARNKMLAAWSAKGGRADLIDALHNAWEALLKILGPIQKGFRDIFPKQTTKSLLDMTSGFKDFTKGLIPSKKTMHEIRDISAGVASVFHIVVQIVGAAVGMFKNLFTTVGGGNGSFLKFAAGIGQSVTNFDKFLKKSGILKTVFGAIGNILKVPLALIKGIAHVIGSVFDGFDTGAASKIGGTVDGIGKKLSGLQVIGVRIKNFFNKVGSFFGNLGGHIADALMGIGDTVAKAFTPDTFNSTLAVINTTLLGGIVLMIKNFFNKGVKIDLGGGLFDNIKKTLGSATGAFESMQAKLKADILMKLAIAIGVMAAALFVLSSIDPGAMAKALGAMSGGFAILIGAMAALMKFLGKAGLVQMYVVSSAMTKMAFSILLLALALKVLSGIPFGDMVRGLVGLAAMMIIMTKAMVPLSANSKGMGKAAGSLILMGIALNILAIALKIFATMSWEEMIRGLAGLTGTLIALGIGLRLMPEFKAQALALIALGVAINLIAIALKIFATMSWEEIGKGMVVLAGSLGIIALAIKMMPKTMMLQAVALVAVAGAMVILSGALLVMGSMGWEAIAKGLIVMAGAMIILAVGLQAIGVMGTIGAVGLLAAAGALAILLPVMVGLGAMSWESILKALTALAAVFVILGVAAYAIGPMVIIIIGLGAALLLLGAGLALAGAGALMAATAFGIVVAAGSAGAQIMIGFLMSIIRAIPPAMAAFGKGVVAFAQAIGKGAPKIAAAFGKVLGNILDQVAKNAPKMAKAFNAMIGAALNVIVTNIPRISNAGLKLIVGFLNAINNHISKIVDLASQIIVKFLNGIGKNIGKIVDAGVRLIIKFIEGMTRAINAHSEELGRAGGDLAVAIINGIIHGIAAGAGRIGDAARNAARDALHSAMDFLGVGSPLFRDNVGLPMARGTALGIEKGAPLAVGEIETLGKTLVSKMKGTMQGVNDAFAIDPNFNPTISPVLDLTALTQEANKMSSILATAPIVPAVSYQTAADISAMTQPSDGGDGTSGSGGNKGDTYVTYEQHLHSPTPLDSVKIYRDGKSLISLKREELAK